MSERLTPRNLREHVRFIPTVFDLGLFPYPKDLLIDSSGRISVHPDVFRIGRKEEDLMQGLTVGPASLKKKRFEVITAGVMGLSNANKVIISYEDEPDHVTKCYLHCTFPFTRDGRNQAETSAGIMRVAHQAYTDTCGEFILPSDYFVDESRTLQGRKTYRVFEKQPRALVPFTPLLYEPESFQLVSQEAKQAYAYYAPLVTQTLQERGLLLPGRTASCEPEAFDLIRGHLLMLDLFDYADPETGTVQRVGANA